MTVLFILLSQVTVLHEPRQSPFLHKQHTEPLTVELFSDDNPTEGAPILSYQQLIDNGLVVLPRL